MIAYITDGIDSFHVLIQEGKTNFSLFKEPAYFLKKEENIRLRVPHQVEVIQKTAIQHGGFAQLYLKEQDRVCNIYYSQYYDGFGVFNRYQYPDGVLTLGSAIDDDLYLQDQHLQQHQFYIDFHQKVMIDQTESGLGSLNGKNFISTYFKTGDVFRIFNLQLVFHDEFIMMNAISNLYRSLLPFSNEQQEGQLNEISSIRIHRTYRPMALNRHFECDLDEPLPIQQMQRQPLIFMMGPAITMASASLTSGLMASYNGYLKGRSIYEMLPMILLPSVMLLSAVFWSPMQRHYEKKKEKTMRKERLEEYLEYLGILDESLTLFQNTYLSEANTCFPSIEQELSFQNVVNIYQKLPHQKDWLMIKPGYGIETFDIEFGTKFCLKKTDELYEHVDALKTKFETKSDCPILIDLEEYYEIVLSGPSQMNTFLRILLSLSLHHGPDVCKMVFLMSEEQLENNQWIYHIPHCFFQKSNYRLVATCHNDVLEINQLLGRYEVPAIFVFALKPSLLKALDLTNIHLIRFESHQGIPATTELLFYEEVEYGYVQTATFKKEYQIEPIPNMNLANFFNRLSFYIPDVSYNQHMFDHPTFYDLYQTTNVNGLKIEKRWNENKVRNGIVSYIGINENNETILLDFHEKGNGPHGLMAGSTGSGKSEMLITILLSLAINYSPLELQFVIIDFKGSGLAMNFCNESYELPHVAGVLSNLDVNEMERALISLGNECKRREALFLKMSKQLNESIMNLSNYQKNWREDLHLPRIAAMLIIVDEFAELKKEKPEFMNDLMTLARVGRSLGIHLLLATQKPSGVVNDQIWSNTRFKLCLKVQNNQDSREMLGVKNAAWLKNPGEFYYLCDGLLTYGKSGYANAKNMQDECRLERLDKMLRTIDVSKFDSKSDTTQLHCVIQAILEESTKQMYAKPLWLPPLTVKKITDFSNTKIFQKGIFLGVVDDFYTQKQPSLYFGNQQQAMAIYSINRKAKLEFLKTILFSCFMALSKEDEIYLIDDLSFHCESLKDVPMVIDQFGSENEEKTRNLFRHLLKRDVHSKNKCFVFITDFSSFMNAKEENFHQFMTLLEGLEKKGIYLILFASSSSSLPYRAQSLLPFRIALKNDNLQELMSIFEMAVKNTIVKDYFGMIKTKHLLEFSYPKVSDHHFQQICQYCIKRYGKEKPYYLMSMPKQILPDHFDGEGIPLGRNIDTYQWCEVTSQDKVLIIATYEEEMYDFKNYIETLNFNIACNPNEKELEKVIDMKEPIYTFMTLDHFQSSILRRKTIHAPVLFIGQGFQDQYIFHCSYRKQLKENEAVFFEKGRNQVIQLVEI